MSFLVNNTQPIKCTTGDLRLVGGTKDYEGRLEVCINNVWGTVCIIGWSNQETRIACKQLGYQELGNMSIHFILINSLGQKVEFGMAVVHMVREVDLFCLDTCIVMDKKNLF